MALGPRYEGLLTDIFKKHKLTDDFSLYLHRPSATDPSVAHRVAMPSMCCRPCPTSTAAPTGLRTLKPIAKRLKNAGKKRCCRA